MKRNILVLTLVLACLAVGALPSWAQVTVSRGTPSIFPTTITPVTNDAAALGSATKSWSDLFLASGGVINWNNGDVTITHASNLVTIAGGDVAIGTNPAGAGALRFANAASIAFRNAANNADIPVFTVDSSNYITLGSATASSAIMPYADDSLYFGSAAVRWRGLELSRYVAIGVGVPSTVGAIRLSNHTFAYSRNAANTADKLVIGYDNSDTLLIGESEITDVRGYTVNIRSSTGTSYVYGPEGVAAAVVLSADDGDDNADKWRLSAADSGTFTLSSFSTGAFVAGLTIDGSGNITGAADFAATTFHVGAVAGCDGTPTASTKGIATTCTGPEASPDNLLLMIQELRAELAALRARQ
jgi:hypothetical protein